MTLYLISDELYDFEMLYIYARKKSSNGDFILQEINYYIIIHNLTFQEI